MADSNHTEIITQFLNLEKPAHSIFEVLLASRLCYPHNLPRKVIIQTQYAISKLDWEMILTCYTLTVDSGRESDEIADPPSVQLVVLDIFHPMVHSLSSLHSIHS